MRIWVYLCITAIAGIAALGSGWHPMYVIFYSLAISLLVSFLFALSSTQGIVLDRSRPVSRMYKGEVLEERLKLENRSYLPKLWIQVTDQSTLPDHKGGYVASVGGRKRIDWRIRTTCRRRGRFNIGPVVAATGDPLGFFTRTMKLAGKQELLVLPRPLPINTFGLLPGLLSGRGRGAQRSIQMTTNAVTVREYAPGDAFSRIHWPSSARQQNLMVREYDLDPTIDIWLVLDMDEFVHAGKDDEATVEYAVTIAATLGEFFLRQDLAVGLLANDRYVTHLALDRGERQTERLAEVLAVIEANGTTPLETLLVEHTTQFMRNSFVICITPSPQEEWITILRQLGRRGAHTMAITIDATSFGGRGNSHLSSLLINEAIPNLLVSQGDDIAVVLQQSSTQRLAQAGA